MLRYNKADKRIRRWLEDQARVPQASPSLPPSSRDDDSQDDSDSLSSSASRTDVGNPRDHFYTQDVNHNYVLQHIQSPKAHQRSKSLHHSKAKKHPPLRRMKSSSFHDLPSSLSKPVFPPYGYGLPPSTQPFPQAAASPQMYQPWPVNTVVAPQQPYYAPLTQSNSPTSMESYGDSVAQTISSLQYSSPTTHFTASLPTSQYSYTTLASYGHIPQQYYYSQGAYAPQPTLATQPTDGQHHSGTVYVVEPTSLPKRSHRSRSLHSHSHSHPHSNSHPPSQHETEFEKPSIFKRIFSGLSSSPQNRNVHDPKRSKSTSSRRRTGA